MTTEWIIESDNQGYWLFRNGEKKAMLYGMYQEWKPIVDRLNQDEKSDLILEILADIWDVLHELAPQFGLRLTPPPGLAKRKREQQEKL